MYMYMYMYVCVYIYIYIYIYIYRAAPRVPRQGICPMQFVAGLSYLPMQLKWRATFIEESAPKACRQGR